MIYIVLTLKVSISILASAGLSENLGYRLPGLKIYLIAIIHRLRIARLMTLLNLLTNA